MDLDLVGKSVNGIGTDVIEIERIQQALERTPNFVNRIYTVAEQQYCDGLAERYAVRFAAKEAVLKALGLGLGGADFKEIEVTRQTSGQPGLLLTGRALVCAEKNAVEGWLISLSHSDTIAQAFVASLGL